MNLLKDKLVNYNILLGSKSPRRRKILKEVGLDFEILPTIETDEDFPERMGHDKVPIYLSQQKAVAYREYLKPNSLLITADTIVSLNNEILGKPKDENDAIDLLNKLSGKCHRVISGVSLTTSIKQKSFNAITDVFFKKLDIEEIRFYIGNYKPFDKAGAYGIQEWIGYIGIEKIEGSFHNVMGLPMQKLYGELMKFDLS